MKPLHKALSVGFGVAALGFLSGAAAQSSDWLYQLNYGVVGPIDLGKPKESGLTPEEMLATVKNHLLQMDQAVAGVQAQASATRDRRQVVKLLCLDDKLSQMMAMRRVAQQRSQVFELALSSKDKNGYWHAYTVLRGLRDRVTAVQADASQCVGEEIGPVGESSVEVTVDSAFTNEDENGFPIADPDNTDVLISRPPVVSSPIQ
ncbi:MAG: hypothetical protein SFV15_06820 [Polyangiaceae bacterium]|nr:hypothetical protein [Polyangiaceae bacterium]